MLSLKFRLVLSLLLLLISCREIIRQPLVCSGQMEEQVQSLEPDIQERLKTAQEFISINNNEFRVSARVFINNQPSITGQCRSQNIHQELRFSSSDGSVEIPNTISLKKYWLIYSEYMWGPKDIEANPESIPPNNLSFRKETTILLEYEQDGQLKYLKSNGIEVINAS